MKSVLRFFDRLVFTAAVLLFLQLPNFMDQYTQRYGGYYEAERQQLESYQDISQKYFDGDMEAMIESFTDKENNPAIRETGEQLREKAIRVKQLKEGVDILENDPLILRITYMLIHFNSDLFFGTMKAYKPGMPFTTEALFSGLVGGVLVSLLLALIRKSISKAFYKKKRH